MDMRGVYDVLQYSIQIYAAGAGVIYCLLHYLLPVVRLLTADGYITVSSFSDSVKSSKSFEVTQPKSSILTPNLPGI